MNGEMQAMKKRLHLAEAARKQARNMEMDYEAVSLSGQLHTVCC